MRLRRFRGQRVRDVVDQVRKELGPNAVILHTRALPRRRWLRFLGGAAVEVVAAADDHGRRTPPVAAPAGAPAPPSVVRPASPPAPDPGLREAMAELRGLLVRTSGSNALHPAVAPLYDRLTAAGLEAPIAFRAAAGLSVFGATGRALETRALEAMLRQALIAMVAVAPASAPRRRAVRVVVGPTGAGKTTTVAKLAVRGHLDGTTTRMLSVDGTGLAAGAPLQALSRVLGLPYALVATADELARAHVDGPASGLTLVDTPGLSPGDSEGLAALARSLAPLHATETHLVLSATTKIDDARAAVAAFTPLGVTHLLFTRLDETRSVGSLLGLAIESRLPLSHFGIGRDIPNDLRPATAEELLRRAFEGEPLP